MTTYTIYLLKTVLPLAPPVVQDTGHEAQREEKLRLIAKIKTAITRLSDDALWWPVNSNEGLDQVSREGLTKILSVVDGLSHLQRDVLLNRPDYATQDR
ncbi:hypothetical protein K439DRAFT_1626271 [Ramaria rubella]|nr:hypothetical protein K439DRAFT_1626271 [Ramaria rubella]